MGSAENCSRSIFTHFPCSINETRPQCSDHNLVVQSDTGPQAHLCSCSDSARSLGVTATDGKSIAVQARLQLVHFGVMKATAVALLAMLAASAATFPANADWTSSLNDPTETDFSGDVSVYPNALYVSSVHPFGHSHTNAEARKYCNTTVTAIRVAGTRLSPLMQLSSGNCCCRWRRSSNTNFSQQLFSWTQPWMNIQLHDIKYISACRVHSTVRLQMMTRDPAALAHRAQIPKVGASLLQNPSSCFP